MNEHGRKIRLYYTTFLAYFWIPVTIFIRRLSEFKIDRRKLYNLPSRFEPDDC